MPVPALNLYPPFYPNNFAYTFTYRSPRIRLRPANPMGERLWLYYGIDRGITLLKNQDGTYTSLMYPTTDQIDVAAHVYMGGHEEPITLLEATALANAGWSQTVFDQFGNNIVVEGAPPPIVTDPGSGSLPDTPTTPDDGTAYGEGVYGEGIYGA